MRTFLLIYGFLFSIGSAISQNLNFAEHVGVDQTSEVVCINSKSYYISRTAHDCGYDLYLNVVAKSGNKILKKSTLLLAISNFGRLIKTNDNALVYIYAWSQSQDVGPTAEYLVKLDTNGNQIFSTKLINLASLDTWDPKPATTDFIQHQDSTYYLLTNSNLLHFSSGGQYLSTISTPAIYGMRSIHNLSNGNLLIHGSTTSSPYVNFIISTGGALVKQNICQFPIHKLKGTTQYYFGLNSGGILEKYDTSLVFQGNSISALNHYSYTITDFALRNDSIFVTGISGSLKNPFYAILNSNLSLIYQTTSSLQDVMPTGISLPANNAVHIVSTCHSASTKEYSFIALHKLNLNGVFNANSNIGVVGFSNLNTRLIKPGPYLCKPYLEMNVTVKNFGADTVKSFYLNSFADNMGGIQYCLFLLHKYNQVNLPPGGTISIPTGSFYAQWFGSDTSKYDSKNVDVCVFTSIPNQSNDTDINNDAYCENIFMTTTGIEKNEVTGANFKLFPNPFNESLTIQSEENISGFSLYNSLGEKIREEVIFAKEYTIQTEGLVSGIYFIRIESENGLLVKKMIKND
jgi:hypothetical protein